MGLIYLTKWGYRRFRKRIPTMPPATSWVTLNRHIFNARIPNHLPNAIRENAIRDKKDEPLQEMLLRGVSKIPISDTFSGLVEMDFADYGYRADLLHLQDTCRDIQC